ncbi:MAG: hypothetical protein A3C55_02470 [Gammaproteobacteria bacterium RIFCSPHIGHO2_02_FULL_42_13]|nr:MAG: hypothetical protein A3C55_02470 [Gammaproteobacteria bacterium RIFCSPHIGHO2_02_FULL_42_13]OGT68821.1 MAG: hypothetical protein A3H43_06050 [Gammaproteobacteria bacterium RIFCSPLOWO2_02_FULL_42_9]
MQTTKNTFALWLKPHPVYYDYLSHIMLELSHRFHSPVFEPHLTLFYGAIRNRDALQALFDQQLNNFSPIVLEVEGVKATEAYFKTLFINFKENAFLNKLFAFVNRSVDSEANYQLLPHLSLLYADMPLAEKMHLSKQIKIALSEIQFDQLELVKIPELHHVKNWRGVKTWKFKST